MSLYCIFLIVVSFPKTKTATFPRLNSSVNTSRKSGECVLIKLWLNVSAVCIQLPITFCQAGCIFVSGSSIANNVLTFFIGILISIFNIKPFNVPSDTSDKSYCSLSYTNLKTNLSYALTVSAICKLGISSLNLSSNFVFQSTSSDLYLLKTFVKFPAF